MKIYGCDTIHDLCIRDRSSLDVKSLLSVQLRVDVTTVDYGHIHFCVYLSHDFGWTPEWFPKHVLLCKYDCKFLLIPDRSVSVPTHLIHTSYYFHFRHVYTRRSLSDPEASLTRLTPWQMDGRGPSDDPNLNKIPLSSSSYRPFWTEKHFIKCFMNYWKVSEKPLSGSHYKDNQLPIHKRT